MTLMGLLSLCIYAEQSFVFVVCVYNTRLNCVPVVVLWMCIYDFLKSEIRISELK